jgi:hypothetical protein
VHQSVLGATFRDGEQFIPGAADRAVRVRRPAFRRRLSQNLFRRD